jgi:hypothetical protein
MVGVVFRIVEGHYDEARDTLVRFFEANPVGTFLNWREIMDRPVFADLVDDPQVQAGLRRYAADEAALRESVRAFLAERERGTGT